MVKPQFAVIGLGGFGYAVARTLLEKGCQVLCIDRLEERLEQVREIATLAVQADATDEKVLREVGVGAVDCAVVSFGHDMEASLLVAMGSWESTGWFFRRRIWDGESRRAWSPPRSWII